MKKLYVMCGGPGSGKSTWIKKNLPTFKGYTKVVSRDEIRFSLVKEDEEYFSKEKEVFRKFIEEIKEGLENCDSVIADATHVNIGSRTKLLRALGESLKDVEVTAVVISVPLCLALEQNEQRAGTRSYVPPTAIKNMFNSFTMPKEEEGFNYIMIERRTN